MDTTSNELKQHGDTFTETTESPNVGSSADNSDVSSSPKTSNEQDGNHNPDQTEEEYTWLYFVVIWIFLMETFWATALFFFIKVG